MTNLAPETHPSPLMELEVEDTHEFLFAVYEFAKRRALELRPAVNSGTASVAEAREAYGWLGLIDGIQEFDR